MKDKIKVFWDKYGDKIAEAAGFFDRNSYFDFTNNVNDIKHVIIIYTTN